MAVLEEIIATSRMQQAYKATKLVAIAGCEIAKLPKCKMREGVVGSIPARFTPKPYMNASRMTRAVGSVFAGLIDCVLISGLVCGAKPLALMLIR
jgi:hypothetical protein